MADPDLLAYIGAVGGVVGAVTGVAGSVIAYVSYKKIEQFKVLDLRIELGKLVVGLLEDVGSISQLLEHAKKSRHAVAAATGMRNSGAMEQWNRQWEADEKSLGSLQEGVEELNANHAISGTKELEEALIVAHALHKTAARLRQSYEQFLTEDEKQREGLRQAARDRFADAGQRPK